MKRTNSIANNKNKKLGGYMTCKNVTDIRTIKAKLAYEEWKKELIEQGVPITSGRSCNYQKSYYENVEWTPLNVSNYD